MKGEYFMMKKHGLRRFFSLLLAVIMVCALLPTAALAEDTTGDGETKTVVVDEKKPELPAPEQPKNEDPPAQEDPEAFTVTYTDGANGAAFDEQVYRDLSAGTATPTFKGTPEREGYTFAGWKPAVAETVTADVTYAAQWDAVKSSTRALTLPPISGLSVTPTALDTGHKIDVTFTVLYVGDEFNIGYNYGSSEKTKFVCQYSSNHSDTAYNNHTIAISDIKAAAGRATVNSGYKIVGWTKTANANPQIWQLNMSGDTACNKGTTIYLVAKNPNPTPVKPNAPSEADVKNLLGNSAVKVHCSTPSSGHADVTYPLMDGSFTVGDVQDSNGNYTCAVTVQAAQYVTAYGNGHTLAGANESPKTITLKHNGTNWTVQSTIPIVFNVVCNTAPAQPTAPSDNDVKALLGENAVQIICTNAQIGHGSKTFGLIDGTFTVHHSNNRCEVVINDFNPYVSAFNAAVNVPAGTHIADNSKTSQNQAKINLVWSDGKWTAADAPAKHHVLCSLQPAKPTAPTEDWFINAYKTVTVNCTNTPAGHGSESYDLVPESIEIGEPTYDSTSGIYSCVVTVTSTSYVAQFNRVKGTHAPETDTALRTVYSTDGKNWVAPSSNDGSVLNPIVFNVACEGSSQAPTAPGHDKLSELIGDITVNCTNDAATHDPRSWVYPLLADSYTIGNVEGTADTGYTLTVTVNAEKYVEQSDAESGATHTPKDGRKVVTLKYENDAWTVEEGKPVSFDVTCVALPTFDELKEIFKQNIIVDCNTKPAHAMARYDLIVGSYAIEDFSTMTDLPTCTVVLNSRKYVESFNGTTQEVHTPENEVKRVGLVLRAGGWGVAKDDDLPVVFQVVCVPDAPTDRYLEDLLNQQVKVTCADPVHAPAVYELLAGSYRGSGVQPDGNGGYTYTVTIAAAEYVKKYNTERPKNHSLVKDEPTEKPVTLVWNADEREWLFADADAVPVNFNVECLYTVTYEDGVNGSVFKPLSFTDLRKGDTTPTIEDPIRVGYEFAGWNPKVQKTVTGDATYTALWEAVDTTFTVKYNDNVKGKAFKEQVYENLKYNEETPDFYGTPTRSGYTFTGWKPVVTDRVTKDVVYYAQWKSSSGKDRVPKTGDGQIVMILGSVLLFSFCGATAVCLNDRKRKQG